jgi:hypothetical protein
MANARRLAGGAVLIAPVMEQIPCKQEIIQGNLQFWAATETVPALKATVLQRSFNYALDGLTGKII